MSEIILVLGLLLFVGLVVVHELGHLIAARRNGVEVEEFGIGFPPRAWSTTIPAASHPASQQSAPRRQSKKAKHAPKSGLTLSLNWLPLGGFVKLKGEHDESREPGSYGAASLWAKTKILLAGVAMNFAAAIVLFTALAVIGMPKADLKGLPFYDRDQFTVAADTRIISNRVHVSVVPDSPADRAGLKSGDELIKVGDMYVTSAEALPGITEKYRGQTVDIKFSRDGESSTVQVTLNQDRGNQGFLGVGPANTQLFRATWSAPIVGVATTVQFTEVTLRGLGYVLYNLFAGRAATASEAIGGPVAMFQILNHTSELGIVQVLFVIALISISLAVMNALPIPALDGGRLFVTLLFKTLKKPLRKEVEENIHGTGFVLLIMLILVITVVDVRRFF